MPFIITLSTVKVVRVPKLVILLCAAPVTVAAVPLTLPVTLPVSAPAKAVAVRVPEFGLYVADPVSSRSALLSS